MLTTSHQIMRLNQENQSVIVAKAKLILVNYLLQNNTHGIPNKVKSLILVGVEVEYPNVLVLLLLIVFNV